MSDTPTPSRFRRVVDRIIRIETTVLLTLFYYTVFGFTAIVLRLCGKKFLPPHDPGKASYWMPHEDSGGRLEAMKRQF